MLTLKMEKIPLVGGMANKKKGGFGRERLGAESAANAMCKVATSLAAGRALQAHLELFKIAQLFTAANIPSIPPLKLAHCART